MSDRIAVMRNGRFEQMGTPEQIYDHPATRFAAEFIGQTNLLECSVEAVHGDGMVLSYAGERIPARKAEFDAKTGDRVCLSLRTERLGFGPEKCGDCCLEGVLTDRRYAGGSMRATIRLKDGHEILAMCTSAERARGEVGQRVWLCWSPAEAPVVRAEEAEV